MKQTIFLVTCCLLSFILPAQKRNSSLPKIAIASFGIESSTFSPALTHEEAFHPKYGDEVFALKRINLTMACSSTFTEP